MTHFRHINTLKTFDWFLIGGVVFFSLLYSILSGSFDAMGTIAGVTGVVCVVLVAKGNIFNYLFGLINVTLYAWISFKAELYGDALLNALYYLPMQFAGWFTWMRKRSSEESVTIIARRLSRNQRYILTAVSVVTVAAGAVFLDILNDPQPVKDSATTILSIIAMFLMVKVYMEQWILWVVVNVISIMMWSVSYIEGEPHSMLMIIMWIFYLVNSVNGWILWIKLSSNGQSVLK
ncbi:MAG: nicotinamide mononucleotide transporter PnuC [Bacteroidetes bacterium HGW-Bacteroidetes-14]|jgi:nicotinamide mononucleotide transporter|nr:MAG: nicotinamide mononucleotide transporter PnuC [Bacteroidetes bacterium HGW-Bacteroidetes-14]